MRLAPFALIPLMAACQPTVVEGPGDPASPAGYRHLDHTPPDPVLNALRILDEDLDKGILRERAGCYAAFVDGQVIPMASGGQQICIAR